MKTFVEVGAIASGQPHTFEAAAHQESKAVLVDRSLKLRGQSSTEEASSPFPCPQSLASMDTRFCGNRSSWG